jgi:hypothetical protein
MEIDLLIFSTQEVCSFDRAVCKSQKKDESHTGVCKKLLPIPVVRLAI